MLQSPSPGWIIFLGTSSHLLGSAHVNQCLWPHVLLWKTAFGLHNKYSNLKINTIHDSSLLRLFTWRSQQLDLTDRVCRSCLIPCLPSRFKCNFFPVFCLVHISSLNSFGLTGFASQTLVLPLSIMQFFIKESFQRKMPVKCHCLWPMVS